MANVKRALRFRVLERDSFTCRYCGASGDGVILHVDHVHPKSRGGANEIDNLVTSCFDCNMGKRDRVMDERVVDEVKMPAVEGWAGLEGKFLHLKGEDGLVHQQGRILAFYGEYVSVEWYQWFTGHASGTTLERMDEMVKRGLYLYRTDAEMREAWDYHMVPRQMESH